MKITITLGHNLLTLDHILKARCPHYDIQAQAHNNIWKHYYDCPHMVTND